MDVFRFCSNYLFVAGWIWGHSSRSLFCRHLSQYLCLSLVISTRVSGQIPFGAEFNDHISDSREVSTSGDFGATNNSKLATLSFFNETSDLRREMRINQTVRNISKPNGTTVHEADEKELITDSQDTTISSSTAEPPKSNLYYSIIKTLPSLFDKYELRDRSCVNRCGISFYCSCRPTCIYFQTCCWDFVEACSDVYDFAQSEKEFQWLHSVEKQCTPEGVLIHSCPKASPLQYKLDTFSNISDTLNLYYESLLNSSSSNNVKSEIRLTFADVLSVLSAYQEMDLHEQDLVRLLSETPILDISTGISYNNISMYVCNGANPSHAMVWRIYYLMDMTDIKLASTLRTFQDISKLIDRGNDGKKRKYNRNIDSTDNVELCNAKAINSCPEGYADYDVDDACSNINFLMAITLRNSSKIFFKNPFCLYCNFGTGLETANVKLVKLTPFIPMVSANHLKLNFNFFTRINDLVIRYSRMQKDLEFSPAWERIGCRFFSPGQMSNHEVMTRNESVANRQVVVRSECWIEQCKTTQVAALDNCLSIYHILLMLPPAKYELSEPYLRLLSRQWKQLLFDIILPLAYNTSIHVEEELYVFDKPVKAKGSPYFQYVVDVKLFFPFDAYTSFVHILKEAGERMIYMMTSDIGYPFQAGNKYVCPMVQIKLEVTVSWVQNLIMYCFTTRNLLVLPEVTSGSEVTSGCSTVGDRDIKFHPDNIFLKTALLVSFIILTRKMLLPRTNVMV